MAQLEEQKSTLQQKSDTYENEIRDLKKKLMIKQDQNELIEKEFAKL